MPPDRAERFSIFSPIVENSTATSKQQEQEMQPGGRGVSWQQ